MESDKMGNQKITNQANTNQSYNSFIPFSAGFLSFDVTSRICNNNSDAVRKLTWNYQQ